MTKYFVALQDINIKFSIGGGGFTIGNNSVFKIELTNNNNDNNIELFLAPNKSVAIMGSSYFRNYILPKCRELTKDELIIMDIIL
jgi:hypothetical protein